METKNITQLAIKALIVSIILYVIYKIINTILYGVQKTQPVDKSKLGRPASFYKGIALELFNAFDGFTQLQLQKERALTSINVLNDEEFKNVYNIFNANYTSGSQTLTTWVIGETVGIFYDTQPKKDYLLRAKKLGLG